jgi:hypothetical protein
MAPILTRLGLGGGHGFGFGGSTVVTSTFKATGGNVSALEPGNGYTYHTFTSTGSSTFNVSVGTGNIEVLVVAAGGGGGLCYGGGGGGGGIVFHSAVPITPGTYTITVGAGGGPLSPPTNVPSTPYNGGNSTFAPGTPLGLTAVGGGGGGRGCGSQNGAPGGSGGGRSSNASYGDATQPTQTQLSGAINYGSPGGLNTIPSTEGSGGGGAGGYGGNGPGGSGGSGIAFPAFTGPLIGVPALAPLSGAFGGGGGYQYPTGGRPGGPGGGGDGHNGSPGPQCNGVTNSGGGGGGGLESGSIVSGSGGPGIVVIRYLKLPTSFSQSTGGTVSTARTGYRVHTFTPSTPSVFQWNAASSIPGVEYLVIGGGGAGGDSFMPFPGYNSGGGGGGAGGMRSGTLTLPSTGSFSVSVGDGGRSWVTSFSQPSTVFAQPGTATSASFPTGTITSEGGGRGGAGNAGGYGGGQEPKSYPAANGGSGGGAVRDSFTTAGTGNRVAGTTTPVPSQGNPGGVYTGPDGHGGGGGGAGAAGGGYDGGAGSTSSITGTSLTYAGGGGGGSGLSPNSPGSGGSGGGGAGGSDASTGGDASPTAPGGNYGAGGGGGGRGTSFPGPAMLRGGNANPGVVIIAVPTAYF